MSYYNYCFSVKKCKACHAGGQGFEPPPGRQCVCWCSSMAEQLICNQ